MKLPPTGLDAAALRARLTTYRAADIDWAGGKTYAYVYDPGGQERKALAKEAYTEFLPLNAIDPTAFPSLHRLETELIGICAEHLGGDGAVVGNFTSGGTESIMLAVKAARDRHVARHPGGGRPTIVMPVTTHAAFHKSAKYLGLERVIVDVDPETFRAIPEALAAAITDDTAMVVVSAPSYAHGVVDPVADVAVICRERDVWLHVDACVGGWLLPYWRRLGADIPAFDFSVPGVCSISMDLHKYAFAYKGASMILHRDADLRRWQLFGCSEWTGYGVVNTAVQSSKSGGPMAGAWAMLHSVGDEGYLEMARETRAATDELVAAIADIDGLDVIGDPEFSMIAARSDAFSVFHLVDEMTARGWFLQAQHRVGPSPANVHFSVTPGNAKQIGALIDDLRACVEVVRDRPHGQFTSMIEGLVAQLPPGDPDPAFLGKLLDMGGISGVGLPGRMAQVNEMLDALPPKLRERILMEFLNRLFVQPG